MSAFRFLNLLILAAALAACAGPGWYAQAISGHYRLMGDRQDIDEALKSGELDPETATRLEQTRDMLAFAGSELRLDAGGSYRDFVMTGQDAVSWNVIAAPEFSLEPRRWCFVVAGCVPYRGYFDPEAAERFAGRLEARGLDVTVSPAIAYSTLGWFEDPLIDTMFRYDDAQLAGFLFHELAHRQLYVRGDANFSEAYASFVEAAGVTAWLRATERQSLAEDWRARKEAGRAFTDLLRQARRDLGRVYASDAGDDWKRREKAARFQALESEYRETVKRRWNGRDYYSGWFARGPNNAQLALAESYLGGVCAFSGLFESAGADWARFHELALARSKLDEAARRDWLQQPCGDIASGDDL
ncbi:MAG: aminopeptidase [Xanthomonadales bacterium]|nr:aminopeptidase [Xanthomonadales bacterium]